jgi:ribosome biogenesis GTPase
MQLETLGWDSHFKDCFGQYSERGMSPARVAREDRSLYLVYGEAGELAAEISGRMRFEAGSREHMPAVGDWVAIKPMDGGQRAIIHGILSRKSAFLRKVAWVRTESQVLAANIDVVFLVMGLTEDFNLRRLERYLALAWESGAAPVVILNKADLCHDVESKSEEVETVAIGVPAHAVSAKDGTGLETAMEHVKPGRTVGFLGSSGVGKSTLINRMLGAERQATGEVREDDGRGRHVTSSRQLLVLPNGGVVIDTPGMRELQMWADESGLKGTFSDIEILAEECRFRDCRHESEPGCAVKQAVEDGRLDAKRLKSYKRLMREVAVLAARKDQRARLDMKSKQKDLARRIREVKKWGRKQ